ncbi:MAG TPA: tetratricopeptide repeat protein [Anaerolineae bacterium]|nr:tetratricopeptide repeat protein [Anaerolineae bacterium]
MADIALRDYISEIDSLIEGSSYDEAISHCRHILTRYPKYLEAYRLLGKAALEKEDDRAAVDMFERVLSVDPEDFVARVGLSIVYDRQGALDDALWQMERGFELMPSNDVIQSELRRLYGRRDGVEPDRISLTRGALARMYTQGDLYDEAIAELRALLKESPHRVDLQILLTETLWRDEQRNEAAAVAERVLEKLPYCLTANLILGEIWLNSGFSEDGETLLRRAQALDPDNLRALTLLGASSPISEQTAKVERLEFQTRVTPEAEAVADEVPDWLAGLAGLTLDQPESATVPGLPAPESGPPIELGPSTEAELPDWLRSVEQPEPAAESPLGAAEETPDWMSALWEQAQPPALEEPLSTPPAEEPSAAAPAAEAAPDWLAQIGAPAAPEATAPAAEISGLDWLSQMEEPPVAETGQADVSLPDWLSDLGSAPAESAPAGASADEMSQSDLPDWLQAMRPPVAETAPAPIELPEVDESEVPEWMAQVQEAPPDQAFEFLQRLGDTAILEEPAEAEPPAITEEAAPAISTEGVPSPDDALAFLQSLAAGKEDQLRAQAEQEAESRMSDIMGRKPSAPAPAPPPPPEHEPAPEPAVEPVPAPAPPELVGMPSADDALAFLQSLTVGKEDQLREEAERAGVERMEAIMGGKPGTSPLRPPTKPLTPPAPEPEPTPAEPVVEPAPAPAPPELVGMPSADDALAFLQSLTVGKEDQLREEAERAGEERMDAIMGGKPGTSPLRPPTKPLTPPEPVAEPEPLAASEPQPEPAPQPVEELPPQLLADLVGADDMLAFLDDLTATPELAPVQSLPEQAPPVVAQAPQTPEEDQVAPSFWLQTAEDEGGASIPDDYLERAAQPPPVAAKPRKAGAPTRSGPPAQPEREAPAVRAAPIELPIGHEEFQTRLQTDPNDHEARLGLARVWWASGERGESVQLYQQLIEEGIFLEEVAGDLQRDLETFEHPDWYRALGDAQLKLGHLADALNAYRQALMHL